MEPPAEYISLKLHQFYESNKSTDSFLLPFLKVDKIGAI